MSPLGGTKLSQSSGAFPVACRGCGQQLHGRVRFCPYCGAAESTASRPAGSLVRRLVPRVLPAKDDADTQAVAVEVPETPRSSAAGIQARLQPPEELRRESAPLPRPPTLTVTQGLPAPTAEPVPPAEPTRALEFTDPSPRTSTRRGWNKLALGFVLVGVLVAGLVALVNVHTRRTDQLSSRRPPPDATGTREEQRGLEQRRMEIARELTTARGQLDRGDVSGARSTVDRILALEPENAEALRLGDDISAREERRDASLRAAKGCIRTSDWPCAISRATEALSMDRGNGDAREIIDRITKLGLGQTDAAPASSASDTATPSDSRPATSPGPDALAVPPAPRSSGDCDAIVRAGRHALETSSYDEAITNANTALRALGLCPGAQQLKEDAMRAKDAAGR